MLNKVKTYWPVDSKDEEGNYKCFVIPARYIMRKQGWGKWAAKENHSDPASKVRVFLPNLRS